MNRILSFWFLLICSSAISTGQERKYIPSPDGQLRVRIISVGHDDIEESYDIVKIFHGNDQIAEYPLVRTKDGMARGVYDSKWSPDSRFFVFLTKYIGGHSIWHSPTSIYDVRTNVFWELDRYIGPVVDDKIRFVGRDVLKIKISDPKSGASGPFITKEFSVGKWLNDIRGGKE